MFALVTTKDGDNTILYGPFVSQEAAESYAKAHRIWGCCLCVRLHDCGDAMDWKA